MTRALATTKMMTSVIGKSLGVVSLIDHGTATYEAYEKGMYSDMFINASKTIFDGFLIVNKSTNPLMICVTIGYTAIDLYTTKP